MQTTPQLILIDLDGTMIDTVPDLAFSVDDMMQQMGLPTRGEARVRDWVGNGVERLVKRALLDQLEGEPDATQFAQAYPLFLESYEQHNGHHSRLYPGVAEGLAWLSKQHFYLGCITNKAERFTLPLLRQLGILETFSLVISGDTLPQQKPDPAPLLHAALHFQVDPSQAWMIGDSSNDVKAARAAKFGAIVCVPYGYNHGQDIHAAKPDKVIDSLIELSTLL